MARGAEENILIAEQRPAVRIDRHLFGHFAEHLGRCIYGGLWVGEDSPVDNVRGIRADVVKALRAAGVPVLRWPGGCFADEYHWEDGIGPRDRRPPRVNTHWGEVLEDNAFGTHEFLDLCGQLGCDPYICGNVGSGTVRELSSWVEYVNGPEGSAEGRRRADNGRSEPWGVRYWGVGNESWGCGGNMSAEHYAELFLNYATYCRRYGEHEPFRIACGPNGSDYRWTEVLMRRAGSSPYLQGLSLHYYTSARDSSGAALRATGFGEAEWYRVLRRALVMGELIRGHRAIMDRWDPQQRVALVVDEWGTWYAPEEGTNPRFLFQQNTMRDALVAAVTLDLFVRHAERVRMANLAQMVNVLQAMILTREQEMVLTPTYHVFRLYRVHAGAERLTSLISSERCGDEDGALEALSATASRDAAGAVHLTVSNLDALRARKVLCSFGGGLAHITAGLKNAQATVVSGAAVDSYNDFSSAPGVEPRPLESISVRGGRLVMELPPRSVVLVETAPA